MSIPCAFPRHDYTLICSAMPLLRHSSLFWPKRRRSTLAVLSSLASEPTEPYLAPFCPLRASAPSKSIFNRLPIELQVEIFTYCLSDFPRLHSNEAPFLIASVCKAWRSVATSTPKLWSSFEIEITEGSSAMARRGLSIEKTMKVWLERSQNHPLSVRVIHIPVGRTADPLSERLLELLISEARRWRYVQFIIPTSNMASLRPKLPMHFPTLRFFSLQLKGFWSSEPVNILAMNIPWHQLASLDLQLEPNSLPSLDDCLAILSKTERLQRCTISAKCALERNHDIKELDLPLLEDLKLILQGGSHSLSQEDAASSLVRYLCLLSAPNLQTLDITWLVQAPSGWSLGHSYFISFFCQISISLRTLCISYLPISEAELLNCLSHVPNVTDLHLRFSLSDPESDPITNHFLSSLTVGMGMSDAIDGLPVHQVDNLLPSLASLSLQCNGSRLSHSVLLEMIQSRWDNPYAQLHHFRLLSMKPVLNEVEKRTKKWFDEGLDISIDTLFIQ